MMDDRQPRYRLVMAALLLSHAGLLAWGGYLHSPAIDEVGHLPSGLYHWQTGRFELYRVNPPLVRLVASFPLFLNAPLIDWQQLQVGQSVRPEFVAGTYFARYYSEQASWAFVVARWVCIPFSLLAAYLCCLWARELYGPAAGLMALILWCFDPNVLGNAQMITPDTGATAFGLLAGHTFWKWLRRPDGWEALWVGVTLGLAQLCKTTWIVLYGLFPAVWLLDRWAGRRGGSARGLWRQATQLAGGVVLSLVVLNAGYGFSDTLRRLGDFEFKSRTLSGQSAREGESTAGEPWNRFRDSWLGAVPVPLPAQYVLGIDEQKADFERGFPSYLRGEWRREGWWYYYLYGLGIKEPVGTLLLVPLAVLTVLTRQGRTGRWRDELVLLAPGLAVLTFVSSQTGFNHHLRYVLPALPFLFIWMSQTARLLTARTWAAGTAVLLALGCSVASSLAVYPHSLSYFNELIGGPTNGHYHLVDSNIEWGQDLLFLKRWAEEHPDARPLYVLDYSLLGPEDVGLKTSGLPPSGPILYPDFYEVPEGYEIGPLPGWYAVGVSFLHADDQPDRGHVGAPGIPFCGYFLRFQPVDRIGYSMNVYHVTRADANRVRLELGLSALPMDWKPPAKIGPLKRK